MATNPGERAADTARVVLITAPDAEVARTLARTMVERRLAACVNLLDGVTSVYRWEGAVEEDPEVLMIVKSRASHLAALERFLHEEHPYDVPELVALEPAQVAVGYLGWLMRSTEPPTDDGPRD